MGLARALVLRASETSPLDAHPRRMLEVLSFVLVLLCPPFIIYSGPYLLRVRRAGHATQTKPYTLEYYSLQRQWFAPPRSPACVLLTQGARPRPS